MMDDSTRTAVDVLAPQAHRVRQTNVRWKSVPSTEDEQQGAIDNNKVAHQTSVLRRYSVNVADQPKKNV
jgi:hypothetical protein